MVYMLEHIKPQQQDKKINKLDDIEKVHPMKQIAIMSVVQVVMLAFMGVSMLLIGVVFK